MAAKNGVYRLKANTKCSIVASAFVNWDHMRRYYDSGWKLIRMQIVGEQNRLTSSDRVMR